MPGDLVGGKWEIMPVARPKLCCTSCLAMRSLGGRGVVVTVGAGTLSLAAWQPSGLEARNEVASGAEEAGTGVSLAPELPPSALYLLLTPPPYVVLGPVWKLLSCPHGWVLPLTPTRAPEMCPPAGSRASPARQPPI